MVHFWYDPLEELRSQVEFLASLGQKEDICFLWRSTTVQHFKGVFGTGLYGNFVQDNVTNKVKCAPSKFRWSHPSQYEIDRVREKYSINGKKVPLINLDSFLQEAHEFHTKDEWDCTHHCFSTAIAYPFLLVTSEAIKHTCT